LPGLVLTIGIVGLSSGSMRQRQRRICEAYVHRPETDAAGDSKSEGARSGFVSDELLPLIAMMSIAVLVFALFPSPKPWYAWVAAGVVFPGLIVAIWSCVLVVAVLENRQVRKRRCHKFEEPESEREPQP
jgi:hypothetical protein